MISNIGKSLFIPKATAERIQIPACLRFVVAASSGSILRPGSCCHVQRTKKIRCRYAARLSLRIRKKFRIKSRNYSTTSLVHHQASLPEELLSFNLLCVYCDGQSTHDRSTVLNVSDDRARSKRPKTRRLNPSFDVASKGRTRDYRFHHELQS